MDIQSIYQVVYTVLFVLAAVFFIMAVFVFFRFEILAVIGDYTGRERKTSGKKSSAALSKRRLLGRSAKTDFVPPPEKPAPPEKRKLEDGSNTVWLDERQTVDMSGTAATADPGKTAEITATGGLSGEMAADPAAANAKACAALAFRSQVKIIVAQSMERI